VWLPDLAVCIMGGCYCIPSPKGEGFTDPKKGTLKVRAELDENEYPKGLRVSNDQLAAVNIFPHDFHGGRVGRDISTSASRR
jgi:hypothetical protein